MAHCPRKFRGMKVTKGKGGTCWGHRKNGTKRRVPKVG